MDGRQLLGDRLAGHPCPPRRPNGELATLVDESGANRGRLCGDVVVFCGVGEAGVPAAEVVGEFVVENPGADLDEQVRSGRCPSHLLPFHHAFADDLVHGRLDERGGDGLAGPVPLPVVGDRPDVR